MDSAIHLALAHPHEVLEFAITMLAQHRNMNRQQAIAYIALYHANCRHGRECPWMPQPPPVEPGRLPDIKDPEWFMNVPL